MDDKLGNLAELKTLCRGNRTDRGWTKDDEDRWTPSIFDRRRIATSHLSVVAENQGGAVLGVQVAAVLSLYSTGPADFNEMALNFQAWQKRTMDG